MICEYCGKVNTHDYRCPLYDEPKVTHTCNVCGCSIYDGEEYIANNQGEYRHYECFNGLRDLLKWLGYEIHTMEGEYEK